MFGDSTTAEYDDASYPQQGWAHYLKDNFTDGVQYVNIARGGYSLKTFLYSEDYIQGNFKFNQPEKSRWAQILSRINKGDYFVFYWGGINDMGSIGRDSYREFKGGEYVKDFFFTDRDVYLNVGSGYGTHTFFTLRSEVDEYTRILSDMITQVKAKGALVLLVRGTGKYYIKDNNEKDVFPASHKYMEALKSIAAKTDVAYLNVGEIFEEEFKSIGFKAMMVKYFLYKETLEHYAMLKGVTPDLTKPDDNVHYNILGAKRICEIFLNELKNSDFPLKDFIK